jgi:hypothetical protein
MNEKANKECEEIIDCWQCECGKHHNCKDGAKKCCTNKKSKICDCRHCKNH